MEDFDMPEEGIHIKYRNTPEPAIRLICAGDSSSIEFDLTPQEARDMAESIIKAANLAENGEQV